MLFINATGHKFPTLRYLGHWNVLTGKTGLLMGNYDKEDRIVFVSPEDD